MEGLLEGVAATSLLVAAVRAAESQRPDALVHDPLAAALVDAVGGSEASRIWSEPDGTPNEMSRSLHHYVAVRTRYLDGLVRDATASGAGQVVLLGAGMDARAYRLPLPDGTVVYEVDTADVLATKARVADTAGLVARAETRPVPADLVRDDWPTALTAAGFVRGAPTAWLAEGLLYYLSAAECAALTTQISALAAPGDRLGAEYPQGDMGTAFDHIGRSPMTAMVRSFMAGGPQAAPRDWLGPYGWDAREDPLPRELAARGRPAPAWIDMSGGAWWFTTATRRA